MRFLPRISSLKNKSNQNLPCLGRSLEKNENVKFLALSNQKKERTKLWRFVLFELNLNRLNTHKQGNSQNV